MKRVAGFFVMAALLFQFAARAEGVGWKIDNTLKYHLVYLPAENKAVSDTSLATRSVMKPWLNNIPAFAPDIDNIVYKNILELGFPLPVNNDAASLKLYLKLYEWPAQLNSVRSSQMIFDAFLLHGLPGGRRLYQLVKNPSNIFVKYASIEPANRVFSEQQPFVAPGIPKQWEFDANVPFSSIYVSPDNISRKGNEADQAHASAQGVIEFHAALSRLYEKSLHLLHASAEKRYFADFRRCSDKSGEVCAVRIYEMPVVPLVFGNYRDLPMPQDAEKVFLSGLLLVKVTDYLAHSPIPFEQLKKIQPGTDAFKASFRAGWSHMLEVGSVFDMR